MKASALLLTGLLLVPSSFAVSTSSQLNADIVKATILNTTLALDSSPTAHRNMSIRIEGPQKNTLFRPEEISFGSIILKQGNYQLFIDNYDLYWDSASSSYLATISIPERWSTDQPYSIELPVIYLPEGIKTIKATPPVEKPVYFKTDNAIFCYGYNISEEDTASVFVRAKNTNPIHHFSIHQDKDIDDSYFVSSTSNYKYLDKKIFTSEEEKEYPHIYEFSIHYYNIDKPLGEIEIQYHPSSTPLKKIIVDVPSLAEMQISDQNTSEQNSSKTPQIHITTLLSKSVTPLITTPLITEDASPYISNHKILFTINNVGKGIYLPCEDTGVMFNEKEDNYNFKHYISAKNQSWNPNNQEVTFTVDWSSDGGEQELILKQSLDLYYSPMGLVKARIKSSDQSGVWKHDSFELAYTLTRTQNSYSYIYESSSEDKNYYQLRFLDQDGTTIAASSSYIDEDETSRILSILPEAAASVEFYYIPSKPDVKELKLILPE